jgi:hypothetical protein
MRNMRTIFSIFWLLPFTQVRRGYLYDIPPLTLMGLYLLSLCFRCMDLSFGHASRLLSHFARVSRACVVGL